MGPWLTEMKRFADKINNTAFVRVCVRFIRVDAAWCYTIAIRGLLFAVAAKQHHLLSSHVHLFCYFSTAIRNLYALHKWQTSSRTGIMKEFYYPIVIPIKPRLRLLSIEWTHHQSIADEDFSPTKSPPIRCASNVVRCPHFVRNSYRFFHSTKHQKQIFHPGPIPIVADGRRWRHSGRAKKRELFSSRLIAGTKTHRLTYSIYILGAVLLLHSRHRPKSVALQGVCVCAALLKLAKYTFAERKSGAWLAGCSIKINSS